MEREVGTRRHNNIYTTSSDIDTSPSYTAESDQTTAGTLLNFAILWSVATKTGINQQHRNTSRTPNYWAVVWFIIMDFVDCGGKHLEIIARSVFLIVWNNQTIFFLSGIRARWILWICCGLLGVFSREWSFVMRVLSESLLDTSGTFLQKVKFLNWNVCQGTLWCWPSQPTTPRRDMSHLWWTGWRGKSHLKSGNNYCLHTQVWYDCFNQSCFGF